MNELKPCPFCWGTDLQKMLVTDKWWIECNSCLAGGPAVEDPCDDEDIAEELWNTRPQSLPEPIKTEDMKAMRKAFGLVVMSLPFVAIGFAINYGQDAISAIYGVSAVVAFAVAFVGGAWLFLDD